MSCDECGICKCKNLKEQKECSMYIDYPEDENCCLVAIDKHGSMSYREIAARIGLSSQGVMIVEETAMSKLKIKTRKFDF